MESSSSEFGVRGWSLSVYQRAGEAGGAWRPGEASIRQHLPSKKDDPEDEPSWVPRPGGPDRSAAEAASRARGSIRRYCTANRLNRLGTLTYRGEGNHDPKLLRQHLGEFFRALRAGLGGAAFPYLWVPEWHKTDHGLHAHFAVGQFVKRSLIEAAWGYGFVHIKLLGDLPVGTGPVGEARRAARYLAKYVGKGFEDVAAPRLHRYDLAQGFKPEAVKLHGRTLDDVVRQAAELMGREPTVVWQSQIRDGWLGPPAVWLSWD